jgi:peptidoglycan/xylan/chitin deacetylase (PgdA/CDA1 family)
MDYPSRLRDDRFAIFLFHGVIAQQTHPVRNYTRKHLEADYFAASLKALLDAGGHPVSLDDVAAHQASGEPLPPKSFGITFDDGFLNNLTVAAPILADLKIPATFYVTSDFIQSNRMSWVDRIEWAVEQVPAGRLTLPWNGSAAFADDDDKRALLSEIRRQVKSDRRIPMDGLATDIQLQLGLPETWATDDPLDRKMTWDQVRELDSDPLFVVGGHSHSHAILSFLSPDALAQELDVSLGLLRDRAGIGPRHYSYPEGLAHCYSDAVIAALKQRGVEICPSAIDGDNDLSTDLFHLRRVMAV